MKNILCYGDSNTWGYIPGSYNLETFYMERYTRNKRWTGILQNKLGSKYHVIEEGLNGRTTNVDYKDFSDRNGKTLLPPLLYTHAPLDLVIIMLGINDLKKEFNRHCKDISQGLRELIEIIKSSKYGRDMQSSPKILLVSTPIPSHENYSDDMYENAIVRAQQFSIEFKSVANKYACCFFDAAPHIKLSEIDGIHFDEPAHKIFAEYICNQIKLILP